MAPRGRTLVCFAPLGQGGITVGFYKCLVPPGPENLILSEDQASKD